MMAPTRSKRRRRNRRGGKIRKAAENGKSVPSAATVSSSGQAESGSASVEIGGKVPANTGLQTRGAGASTDPENNAAAQSAKGKRAKRRRSRKRGGRDGEKQPVQADAAANGREHSAAVAGVHPQAKPASEQGGGKHPRRRNGSAPGHGAPNARPNRNGWNEPRRELYAALDLGTNNCRLLIARPEDRGFRVVDAYSRIVRLGEGVDANRRLSHAAMDRAVEALGNCHRKLAERGVQRARLIATEACRAAENGEEFIERVRSETGLALEIVDRETEARLAVAGCVSLVDQEAEGVILFDIGGGSSEIVWLDLRNRCGARGYALTRFIRSWISLPVGVVNLAERHGGMHVTPDIFEAMVADAADHLAGFSLGDELTEAIGSGRVHMLGTSGTVTTLAGVHFGLKRYDRRRVDGAWLENTQVGEMIDRLRDMPYEDRVQNPCIGADRADLVLAGCAILEAIRRRWSCSRLRVADRGLREGILTELMAADGVWSRRKPGRRPGGRRRGQS